MPYKPLQPIFSNINWNGINKTTFSHFIIIFIFQNCINFVLTRSATFITNFGKIWLTNLPIVVNGSSSREWWNIAVLHRRFPFQKFAFQSTKGEIVEKKDT